MFFIYWEIVIQRRREYFNETKFLLYALVGLVALLWSAPVISADMSELDRKIDILSDELDILKEGDMLKNQRGRCLLS